VRFNVDLFLLSAYEVLTSYSILCSIEATAIGVTTMLLSIDSDD